MSAAKKVGGGNDASSEACDDFDNDCDGKTDEGVTVANLTSVAGVTTNQSNLACTTPNACSGAVCM